MLFDIHPELLFRCFFGCIRVWVSIMIRNFPAEFGINRNWPEGGGRNSNAICASAITESMLKSKTFSGMTLRISPANCTSPNVPRERLSVRISCKLTTWPESSPICFCAHQSWRGGEWRPWMSSYFFQSLGLIFSTCRLISRKRFSVTVVRFSTRRVRSPECWLSTSPLVDVSCNPWQKWILQDFSVFCKSVFTLLTKQKQERCDEHRGWAWPEPA